MRMHQICAVCQLSSSAKWFHLRHECGADFLQVFAVQRRHGGILCETKKEEAVYKKPKNFQAGPPGEATTQRYVCNYLSRSLWFGDSDRLEMAGLLL